MNKTHQTVPLIAITMSCLSLVLTASAYGQTNLDNSRLLASQCAQCHGYNGYSVGGIESIANEAGEISEEMLEAHWDTGGGIMDYQARGYTPEQVELLAQWFASGNLERNRVAAPLSQTGSGGGTGGADDEDYEDHEDHEEDEHFGDRDDRDDDEDVEDRDDRDDDEDVEDRDDRDDDEDMEDRSERRDRSDAREKEKRVSSENESEGWRGRLNSIRQWLAGRSGG